MSGAEVKRSKGTANSLEDIHAQRLFLGSCFALAATAIGFAVTSDIMGALKAQFLLSNAQAGIIAGAWLWGFTISILLFGPFVDALGMRFQLRLAIVGHIVGVIVIISATFFRGSGLGFWVLLAGHLIVAMGNGLIEAVCNPMIATVYPEQKTQKLNQFHVWFPGGIFIGGVTCWLLSKTEFNAWQLKVGIILIPAIIYAFIFLGQKYPLTERAQSGLSFGEMVRSTLLRPLFIVLLICMGITASLELGPNRWIPSVYGAVGLAGILMLAWINGLMAIMRYYAGHAVERFAPSGMLLISAVISGIGLYLLSFAETKVTAFAAATVFAVGVCYFWPTMLGVAAERVPRGGALALALLGGFGNIAVGVFAIPLLGTVADDYIEANLQSTDARAALVQVVDTYPAPDPADKPTEYTDLEKAHFDAENALAMLDKSDEKASLMAAASALRSAAGAAIYGVDDADKPAIREAAGNAGAVIGPMDNAGGRLSFRYLAPSAIILIVVFGTIYMRDKGSGGYKIENISG